MNCLKSTVESQFKKFHFQEIGWLICFPAYGNQGKYCDYTVILKKGSSQPGKRVKLGDVLESPEFEQHYPHTVGYYRVSSGEGAGFKPDYLELRKIGTVEEFWLFLNALDI